MGADPVDGFADERFAVAYKTNHAMADAISAVDIGMLLVDAQPTVPPPGDERPWRPRRELAWSTFDLAELKRIKNALGGTVNDISLAVVNSLRAWLAESIPAPTPDACIRIDDKRRGVDELPALVPVSIRSVDEHG